MRQLSGMSKKRPNPFSTEEVFHSMSSKRDLYNHLDKHLQVSISKLLTNFVVLYMSILNVH